MTPSVRCIVLFIAAANSLFSYSLGVNVTFSPTSILLIEERGTALHFNYSCYGWMNISIRAWTKDSRVASARYFDDSFHGDNSSVSMTTTNPSAVVTPQLNVECSGKIQINARRLGRTEISLEFTYIKEYSNQKAGSVHVELQTETVVYPDLVVIRAPRLIDQIFRYVTTTLVAIITFFMGCTLNIETVKGILKKPVAPLLGFCSQYVMMPLLAFAVSQITQVEPAFGLGLLTIGCSPGGGASNIWTVLLGGELELSITMTFLSTCLALGMMPLWLFLLGRFFVDESKIKIPYDNVATTIATLVGPVALGLLLHLWKPKLAMKCKRLIRPLALIFLIYIYTFGMYVNWFIWGLLADHSYLLAVGIITPWCGYIFGFFLAKIFRQPKRRAITIALETGIQNIGIPMIILRFSLPQPDGDLGSLMPSLQGLSQMLPLYLILIALTIKRRCCDKGDDEESERELKDISEVDNSVCNSAFEKHENGVVLDAEKLEKDNENGQKDEKKVF
ncbi:ileal sodium/bile acid cotransporter [Lingula anatina]|uniref:Ileal sodium/bile acid cotransporter n=1 Tax=Lingula anatina TaxID=7574 RepID=A0A1S3ISZ8_LINAN|nr:ileal sodium/bile acid cotransporter [Lingula anatina]|eukprot:XP_013401061.1 ileal sodium/bile acid cotransporter [Lingula anatina]